MKVIDGLPDCLDRADSVRVRVSGSSAVVCCDRFIARVSLITGNVDWVVERSPIQFAETYFNLPRSISLFGEDAVLWFSDTHQMVVELVPTECGAACLLGRDAVTGAKVWEQSLPIPEAADWTEAIPAWPGAKTEEIYGFIANDPECLVVCLTRHTRRSMLYSPSVTVDSVPRFACQTDAMRFHPRSGKLFWRAVFPDVPVGLMERKSFTGIWASSPRIGAIDLETGTNRILQELPHTLGWPKRDGSEIAVSWHSKEEVGVAWVDARGNRAGSAAWRLRGINGTCVHPTAAGLALQTNDQGLWWLGQERSPLWNARTKPYIYRVHRALDSDVFVGTDGNGGRLFGFEAQSGREMLNLKPALGGVGHLVKIPGHAVLMSTFAVSRSSSATPRLLILSMQSRQYTLDHECYLILGTWEHGAVCRVGRQGGRIGVIDIRLPEQTQECTR